MRAPAKPRRLGPGDRVHIVTAASPVQPSLFEQGAEALRGMGLDVRFEGVFEKWRYLAGDDSHRASQLQKALSDPECRAIFFARGGYGSMRLLNGADSFVVPKEPRILLGCSDITSLHQYFQRIHNWVVFHGPMPSGDIARGQLHLRSFRQALMEADPYVLDPDGVQALIPGAAEGRFTGGCLTLLHATLGTPWEPDWNGAILFLEDVSTRPYQIDRMLTHLKLARKFEGVRAVVFGEMKDCVQVENQGYTLQEVCVDVLGGLGIPIYYGFPSGHVSGLNWTLPLGVQVRVDSQPSFRVEVLESCVEP